MGNNNFREPWSVAHDSITNVWGHVVVLDRCMTNSTAQRIVECVNAFDGIKDPAAFMQLAKKHVVCLICGAHEPCMAEEDLGPGDPGTPCTFDPPPQEAYRILEQDGSK